MKAERWSSFERRRTWTCVGLHTGVPNARIVYSPGE